jgi:hypothetical protein
MLEMGVSIKDNGIKRQVNVMDSVFNSGQMALSMRDYGKEIKLMARVV